jgi:uncharacterized protein (DUF433 family)
MTAATVKGRAGPAYVEERDGGYWVAGTRVSLDSVVIPFLDGESADSIAWNFPSLTLEQVHGSLAFYLANRAEIDGYLERARAEYEARRAASRAADPAFHRRLAALRRRAHA